MDLHSNNTGYLRTVVGCVGELLAAAQVAPELPIEKENEHVPATPFHLRLDRDVTYLRRQRRSVGRRPLTTLHATGCQGAEHQVHGGAAAGLLGRVPMR